jgi:diphthine-ammonia ligase
MGLPLFTRDIKGKAVERGPEYGSRTSSGEGSEVMGDETEDLYMLVKKIKVSLSSSYHWSLMWNRKRSRGD